MGNTGTSANDSFPAEVRVFEVCKNGKTKVRDGKVAHHLGDVGLIEFIYHFGINNHFAVNEEVRDKRIHKDSLVSNVKALLLIKRVASIAKFDDKRILIRLFAQPWTEGVKNLHAGTDNRVAQFAI